MPTCPGTPGMVGMLKPRRRLSPNPAWTDAQWVAYLEGWCYARLGYPRPPPTDRQHFDLGLCEALVS